MTKKEISEQRAMAAVAMRHELGMTFREIAEKLRLSNRERARQIYSMGCRIIRWERRSKL